MKTLILDFETHSKVDLKEVGAYEYARHPSTIIECAGYKYGLKPLLLSQPSKLVLPKIASGERATLKAALADPAVKIIAHNAMFDFLICTYVLKIKTPLERWHCTAAQAASAGLPRSLDGATAALGTVKRKDKAGAAIMKKLASTVSTDIDHYMQLYAYCLADIDATAELYLKTPELIQSERRFWLLDQVVNLRGFQVDRQLVTAALKHIEHEVKNLDNTIAQLTGGDLKSSRQVAEVKRFAQHHGVYLPNMQADTIAEVLQTQTDMPDIVRQVLENRSGARRSSTAKYQAFESRSRFDGRARDNLVFYGAHTGRQSGTGLQPQNLFKSVVSEHDVEQGIKLMLMPDSVGFLSLLFDSPMDLFASVLRSCIVAAPGRQLLVGDFSTIEVCVLFWMAEHHEGIKALTEGRPIYLEMASKIYGEPLELLIAAYGAGDESARKKRQLGKATELGCGFGIGLGGDKFQVAAKSLAGLTITKDTAKRCVRIYRSENPEVVQYWDDIERAARMALIHPGRTVKMKQRGMLWKVQDKWLTVTLPNGRKLWYFDAKLQQGAYGPVITYMAMNSTTKKYERTKTWGGKLTENVVQATARDLLYESLARLEHAGLNPVLTVHDEIVCEVDDNTKEQTQAALYRFTRLMSEPPLWAKDLPIKVESWMGNRYKK